MDDAYRNQVACVASEWKLDNVTCPQAHYGEKTLEEDVADVIGVSVAYGALERVEPEFFYAFAQLWCSVLTPQAECAKIQHDVHAIPRVRVDATLKHMRAFRETFRCPVNHPETTRMVTEKTCTVF